MVILQKVVLKDIFIVVTFDRDTRNSNVNSNERNLIVMIAILLLNRNE